MAKVEHPDFATFKSEFTRWQQRLGLTGYHIYFEHKPLEGHFAEISLGDSQVATARLNSCLPPEDLAHEDPKRSAKHEAIHLLVWRLEHLAQSRYLREGEIGEASEELVRKLEGLIDG